MTIHVVSQGETVESIAAFYGVPASRIISDNELTDPDRLADGQTLVILFPEVTYTVREGDTLYSIAAAYGISAKQLLRNNPQASRTGSIFPGETLVISYSGEKIGRTAINGYAYPFIDRTVLRKTLPYLTYLSIFTYGFETSGELVTIDDEELIALAREYDVSPVMMISAMTPDGHFSNDLASLLFNDPELQNRVIDSIIMTMNAKGYDALDVDFEYIFADDADAFTAFIANLEERLSPYGWDVFVALAPKTSAAQAGLLYEGQNYAAIGAETDRALLMTYEWGYTYGPPMAISPENRVREVIEFGVSQIPSNKIFMGVSNYAYDWRLPFIRGESRAESLGNVAAVDLAERTGSTILFDNVALSPYFFYTDADGAEHVVWFEDARSIDARMRLVPQYGLYGASVWNIMRFFPQSWLVINSLFDIDQA